jgi:phage/plasmid-associated DNA primase
METITNNLLTNWTITKKTKTIYEGVECLEKPNQSKLYGYMKTDNATEPNTKEYGFENDITLLKKYISSKTKEPNSIKTAHSLPKGQKFSRSIPKSYLSMAVMRRKLRHTLCEGIYVDIDMRNAQPTIITSIAKNNNYTEIIFLEDYVKNRDGYLNIVMETHNVDKKTAKELFISLITGGTYDYWLSLYSPATNDTPIEQVCMIETEVKNIRELVYISNPKITAEVKKEHPDYTPIQIKKSVFSKWYFTIERNIQETAISYLVEHKDFELKYIIPSQDGFMILKEYDYPTLITEINTHTINTFNIPVEFVVKPFDEVIIDCPDGVKPDYKDYEIMLDEKGLGDQATKLFGEYIKRFNGMFFIYRNGRWFDETDKSNRFMMTKYISEDLYNYISQELKTNVDDEGIRNRYLSQLRHNTSNPNIIKHITHHIESNIPNEPTNIFNKNPHLLGFNNGVYNLITQEFRDYNYDDYITLTTGWDYTEPTYDTEEQEKMRKTLIDILETIQPDREQQTLLLQILASGLDGHPYQNAVIYQGQGGNGKGLLGSLMNKMLGEYFYKPNASILKEMAKANSASPDIMKLKDKRYVDIEEVGGMINATLLRNITGGQTLEGRNLYQKTTETFKLSSLLVLEINNAFQLDGKPAQADYRRYIVIKFNTNFTDDEAKIDEVINGIQYRKANHYYETEEFHTDIRPYFFDVLSNVYKQYYDETQKSLKFSIPKIVRDNTNQYLTNQDTAKSLFDYSFKKSNDLTKTLPLKSVWDTIKNSDPYNNLSKADKKAYGRDEIYKYVMEMYNIPPNPNSHKPIIVKGIEKIETEDNNEEIEGDM